jgi:hypothetical protein
MLLKSGGCRIWTPQFGRRFVRPAGALGDDLGFGVTAPGQPALRLAVQLEQRPTIGARQEYSSSGRAWPAAPFMLPALARHGESEAFAARDSDRDAPASCLAAAQPARPCAVVRSARRDFVSRRKGHPTLPFRTYIRCPSLCQSVARRATFALPLTIQTKQFPVVRASISRNDRFRWPHFCAKDADSPQLLPHEDPLPVRRHRGRLPAAVRPGTIVRPP